MTATQTVPVDRVKVREGFNVRDVDADLKTSVAALGILVPLILEEDGKDLYVVAGHRRLAAAKAAGLGEVPYVLEASDGNGRRDVVAAAENISRADLDAVQEATAIKRLLDAGMTDKGVQDTLGVSARWVTERKLVLAVPEAWHPRIAAGYVSSQELRVLVSLYEVEARLGDALLKWNDRKNREQRKHTKDYPMEACRVDGWAVVRAAEEANGLWPLARYEAKDLKSLKLPDEARERLPKLTIERYGYAQPWATEWTEADVDRFRAAGVLWEEPGDDRRDDIRWRDLVVTDTELFRQVVVEKIEAAKVPAKSKAGAASTSGDAGKDAEKKVREKRAGLRDQIKELQTQARGLNLELGANLMKGLAKASLTAEALDVVLSAAFRTKPSYYGGSVDAYQYGELAMAGMRYVHPDYSREVEKGKRKVRAIEYDAADTAEKRLVAWLAAARTPQERLGRHLAAVCAAALSIEEAATPKSARARFYARGEGKKVEAAIAKLAKPYLPRGLEQCRKALRKAEADYAKTLGSR